MNGDNSVESGGAYSAGLLSQVNDSEKMVNNTRLETTDKTNIVTSGENAVGVLACSSPGESRTCVDAVDDEVSDSNLSLIHISEPTRPGNTSRMPSSA